MAEQKTSILDDNDFRDAFDLFKPTAGSPVAQSYDIAEKSSGRKGLLWRFRTSSGPEESERFLKRMILVSGFEDGVPEILYHGVDGLGHCVVAQTAKEGTASILSVMSSEEVVDLFRQLVLLVSRFHRHGVTVGLLEASSFVIDGTGEPQLQWLMGPRKIGKALLEKCMSEGSEFVHYRSPEERVGMMGDMRSDIYALGVLGYRMLSGTYPFLADTISEDMRPQQLESPSSALLSVRPWVDEIVWKCLQHSSRDRFQNAEEMLNAIDDGLSNGVVSGITTGWKQSKVVVRVEGAGKSKPKNGQDGAQYDGKRAIYARGSTDLGQTRKRDAASGSNVEFGARNWKLLALFAAAVFLAVLLVVVATSLQKSPEKSGLDVLIETLGPDVRLAAVKLIDSETSAEDKDILIAEIGASDDTGAMNFLSAWSASPDGSHYRNKIESSLLERLESSGCKRTAEQLRQWQRDQYGYVYDKAQLRLSFSLGRSCDNRLPLEFRVRELDNLRESNRSFALRLVGALALDGIDGEEYIPVLRRFLSDTIPISELDGKSLPAMVLASNDLAIAFGEEAMSQVSELNNSELRWLIVRTAEIRSLYFKKLVNVFANKEELPPFQKLFLKMIDGGDNGEPVTPELQLSLARAAFGRLLDDDVKALANWYSLDAEKALCAASAIASDPGLSLFAFESLAGRSVIQEPGKSLVAWGKRGAWEKRQRIAKPVGILCLYDIASESQINYALDEIMPIAGQGVFFETLKESKIPKLHLKAVERFGQMLPSADLLDMLHGENPELKKLALRSLAGRNEVQVLRLILRAYEKEDSEEIRELYRKYHWVTAR